LSLASSKGLLAAAGPSELIIARTKSVRGAYAGGSLDKSGTRPFTPELTISLPTRISQVAFTTDEKYLVVSAESNGGLAVYDVQSILQGGTTPAFEIGTLDVSLSALIPNPSLERASFLALVTINGDLLIINLENRQFVTSSNGPVLKSGVSCVCWSRLGKQLVAGLRDGSAYQLTPEGVGKAEIPKPPLIEGDYHGKSH
jgi:nucleoporin NUP159